MKPIFFLSLLLISFTVYSQMPYTPSDPSGLKLPVTVNNILRSITVSELTKNKLDASKKPVITTVEGLRSMTLINNPSSDVVYSTTNYDAGEWLYDPASTLRDDTGRVIKPAGLMVGRFIRRNAAILKPEMWGAVPDGTTDCTNAVRSMFINAMKSDGTGDVNVHFSTGHYRLRSDWEIATSGKVSITGDGPGTQIDVDGNNYTLFPTNKQNGVFYIMGANGVTIENLIINGGAHALLASKGTLAGTPAAVYFYGCKNTTIRTVIMNDVVAGPQYYGGVDHLIDNVFVNKYFGSGVFALDPTRTKKPVNLIVSNCHIIGLGDEFFQPNIGPYVSGIGVLASDCSNIKVIHSLIEDTPDTGTKTEGCDNVSWIDNTVVRAGKDGIKFQQSNIKPEGQLSGGAPSASNITGVANVGGRIEGNRVYDLQRRRTDGGACILVSGSSQAIITNNYVHSYTRLDPANNGVPNEIACRVQDAVYDRNRNITISNNNFQAPAILNVQATDNISIFGNTGKNAIFGLCLVTGSSEVDIYKNHFFNDTLNAAANAMAGIEVSGGSKNARITDNTVRNVSIGIQVGLSASNYFQVNNNVVDSTGKFSIRCFGGAPTTPVGNISISRNTVSAFGLAQGALGALSFDCSGYAVDFLDLSRNAVNNGNGYVLSVIGTGLVKNLDLTGNNYSGSGISDYSITATQVHRIIGGKMSAPPSSGSWRLGDVIDNANPAAGATSGWKVTTAGAFTYGNWVANTAYSLGTIVTGQSNRLYRCVVAGVSSTGSPSSTAYTNTDGTVTWEYLGFTAPIFTPISILGGYQQ